jgi:hypothetical protein
MHCAGLTGNSARLRTVLSSRLSHTELRSSIRESHSFPPFICRHHDGIISRHFLRFLFFFADNITADVASKQQTTPMFLSTIVTRTRRHTELTKKLTNLMGNQCCAREHSLQFFTQFNLECMGPFKMLC